MDSNQQPLDSFPTELRRVICSVGFKFIGILRHMQRYFSHISDGTDVQADWRISWTYGRAPTP